MSVEPKRQPYVAARVNAFNRANARVLLCAECWLALVKSPRPLRETTGTPGWCTRCGRGGATIMAALLPRRPGRRRASAGTPAEAAATVVTCPACGEVVVGDKSVVIQADERVAHLRCATPVCPECARAIGPDHRVMRDGAELFHPACLLAHRRRRIAGGAGADPWTTVFHERLIARAARDRAVFDELRAISREVHGQSRTLQAWARCVRGGRHRAAA
jgi:hypothetical protein